LEIIPVIDLLGGQVVHAKRGERHRYKPIVSKLCSSSEPLFTVEALLELYPFHQLYIADIDAITNSGDHAQVVAEIGKHFPQLNLWLDCGMKYLANGNTHWILGTESVADINAYKNIDEKEGMILSLDFTPSGYKGPQDLIADSDLWPQKVIAMSLQHVGSSVGPAIEVLHTLLKIKNSSTQLYAAGGIRNSEDAVVLSKMGIAGALVATALHNGNLGSQEIASLGNL
jgi:phosphoribosylformimino-5-aminoimidazole carboxamide ribotide isomerase